MRAVIKQERWKTAEVQRLLELRFLNAPEAQQFAAARCRRDKQQAWERVSQRLRTELPLASGDARSPAQCEQKLKNLRKEYLRLRTEQIKRSGNEGGKNGTMRLPAYWQLMEETLGSYVETTAAPSPVRAPAFQIRKSSVVMASPASDTQRRELESRAIVEPATSVRQNSPVRSAVGKRRRASSELADESSSSSHSASIMNAAASPGNDEEPSAISSSSTLASTSPPLKRSRGPSAKILQSVSELNKLVASFMAKEDEAEARSDVERRLAAVESDMAALRSSVQGMNAKMDLLLSYMSERHVVSTASSYARRESSGRD